MNSPRTKLVVPYLMPLAPPLVIGFAAVTAASAFDAAGIRILLQCIAVGAATLMAWRAGIVTTRTRQWVAEDAPTSTPESLSRFTVDRRRPTFDRDTGLCVNWYFRLRVEEEIARAERYHQPFTMITISAAAPATLENTRLAIKQALRAIDFAGDLGNKIAVLLPHTDRAGADIVASRLGRLAPRANIRVAQFPQDGTTVSHLLGDDEWRIAEQLDLAS
jgi:hypothetical protein